MPMLLFRLPFRPPLRPTVSPPAVDAEPDAPQCNPAAVALAERHGMTPCFETARMYTGAVPDTSLERGYGIISFELG